jgi:phosphohistidine phosphatase
MKTLLLMRHAKSSWKDNDLKDHERPLAKRGMKNAPRMGDLIKEAELVPQRILSSTALRARQTAEAVAEKSGYLGEIIYLDSLYLAEPPIILDILRLTGDDIERVMVVGHNPGLEALMQILSGRVEALTTASVAYFVLPIDHWRDLGSNTQGELIQLWRPKDLD